MNLIKTTAFVEDEEHLKLNQKLKALQKGTEVELAIFIRGDRKNNWKEERNDSSWSSKSCSKDKEKS